ncbi:MAG: choice-of-anchor J domain-containing protein [Prevotella sp.]|nr:choice-of-anchor J domain-containing protein [Prevotella sp.]
MAQNRDKTLTIQVSSVKGDVLNGQVVKLEQTEYQADYGTLKLNAEGSCTLKVFAGQHRVTIERAGFEKAVKEFQVEAAETTISVQLVEKTRTPFSLQTVTHHDAFTGNNSVTLSWNKETPAFFDDFESYDGWATQFGQWTGIDGDQEAAAALLGMYPNRNVMQYAQIINPLTVEPTWWYDYPILRPYDGKQYVGFTRTSSGNQNDDWLITPAITVGTDNILEFMAKAADRFPERFMVYVTTKTDNPVVSDFVRLDKGNYESVDYTGWKAFTYDLSDYAGQQVKLAIRYISHYNANGSFMLMVDNVYVGQNKSVTGARQFRSPANPNEVFHIFLDGNEVGTTEAYSYTIDNVPSGIHTLGVKAVYRVAQSDVVTTPVEIAAAANFSKVEFLVSADSKLTVDGQVLQLVNAATSESYELTVANGKAEIASLPNGTYLLNVAEGAFNDYQQTIEVSANQQVVVALTDRIIQPYNITAKQGEEGSYTLRWNQVLSFSDSFEDYDDFATGSFGDWITIDNDKQPVYPIALGGMSNIVSFPGSGTATNPTAIAPMVFNPKNTVPAMAPTDAAIIAPTGDKTVIFFSAQRGKNDKWLISPLFDIHEDYSFGITAKGYDMNYPETMEFCISDGSTRPEDFHVLSVADPVSSGQWSRYNTSLANYAGKTVRLAVHYTSTDTFLAQVDDFTVGKEDGGEVIDFGNVVRFDIYLDGQLVGSADTPVYELQGVQPGSHVVGIKAIYQNGASEMAQYQLDVVSGIVTPRSYHLDVLSTDIYTLAGQKVKNATKGVYIMNRKKFVK